MTERIPLSLAVSALIHTVVIATAAILLSRISQIDILPTAAPSFILVETETRSQSSLTSSHSAPAMVSLPAIPKPVIAPPTPNPAPEKVSRPSTPAAPRASTRPAAPATTTSPQMSFKDFQAAHGQKPPAANKIVPRITVPDSEETNTGISSNSPSPALDSVDVAERNAFNAQIVQKLRQAYQPVGGEDRTFFCRIEFTLSTEGRVASSRILSSSGNRLFDKAVLEALARLRVSTPPQSLVGDPLTTTFQVEP